MIKKFNLWAESLVVVIAITTIIEMLLPEGNNKKYIKMVCSIYILFIIINPILNLNKIDIKDFKINDESIDTFNYSTETVTDMYIKAYENQIKDELIKKGYKIANVKINLDYLLENIKNIQIITQHITEEEKEKLIKTIYETYKISDVIII